MIRNVYSRVVFAILFVATAAFSAFDPCRFNVGVDLKQASTKKCGYLSCTKDVTSLDIPSSPDFVAEYVGVNYASPTQLLACGASSAQEGLFLKWAKQLNSTPLWYTYIIAGDMKFTQGLDPQKSDCNQGGSKTICTEWGAYFSAHRADIINNYKSYAEFAASNFGTDAKMIWALEPDFYQYASGQNGNSRPISFNDASKLISDIIDAIKSAMPNAQIAMDISAWAPDNWFTSMPLDKIDYFHASGGTSQPGSNIQSANPLSWSHLYSLTRKPMIADDGYGVGGGATSINQNWFNTGNVQSRMNDGVIGIMEASPSSSLTSSITSLHALKVSGTCAAAKFTLSVTAGNGGSVSVNPTGTSFDAGATVKLKATPQAGYKFTGWTGGVTGTKDTITVVMNANMTITAGFATLPKYNLTINQSTGGTISANPAGSSFDSGTSVKLTATAQSGFSLSSWTSGVTGTKDTATLVMNSNKTVSATFTPSIAVLARSGNLFKVDLRGNQLSVALDRQGLVEFSFVSLDGKSIQRLGSIDMQGQEQIFGLGNRPVGLQYLRMRGEGWERIVPMAAFAR